MKLLNEIQSNTGPCSWLIMCSLSGIGISVQLICNSLRHKDWRSLNRVVRRGLTLLFAVSLLFVGGCGASASEIGATELAASVGVVILSWIIIVILNRFTKRANLLRNIVFWVQYALYLVLSMALLAHIAHGSPDVIPVGVVSIPYLLFFTSFFLLILPKCMIAFVPSILLLPHFVTAALLYATNRDGLLMVSPMILSLRYWHIMLLGTVMIIVVMVLVRREAPREKERSSPPEAQENNEQDPPE